MAAEISNLLIQLLLLTVVQLISPWIKIQDIFFTFDCHCVGHIKICSSVLLVRVVLLMKLHICDVNHCNFN